MVAPSIALRVLLARAVVAGSLVSALSASPLVPSTDTTTTSEALVKTEVVAGITCHPEGEAFGWAAANQPPGIKRQGGQAGKSTVVWACPQPLASEEETVFEIVGEEVVLKRGAVYEFRQERDLQLG